MNQEHKPVGGKTKSPEKLNEYIRTGSAGGFILIAALIIMAAALVVWGFIGRIPVTSSQVGIVADDGSGGSGTNTCLSFVEANNEAWNIHIGNPATLRMLDEKTFKGNVKHMTNAPLSADELRKMNKEFEDQFKVQLSEWLMENLLGDSKYYYVMYIETEEDISDYWNQMANITVVLEEVQPISFLLK